MKYEGSVVNQKDLSNKQYVDGRITYVQELIPSVEDNLTSDSGTNALSAKQGKILDGKITSAISTVTAEIPEIIDSLDSDATDKALSAKQGKVLDQKLITALGDIDTILQNIVGEEL